MDATDAKKSGFVNNASLGGEGVGRHLIHVVSCAKFGSYKSDSYNVCLLSSGWCEP